MPIWAENGHLPGGNKMYRIGSKIVKCEDLAVWMQPKNRIKGHVNFDDFL